MSTDNMIALIVAGLAFVASIAASIIAWYNTRFHRFISEKWWERKAEAYTRIIEALTDIVDYYGQIERQELGETKLTPEKIQEIGDRWKQAHDEVTKVTNMGTFIISVEAERILQDFRKASKKNLNLENFFEGTQRDYENTKKCIEQLIQCGKKDLEIKPRRWPRST